MDDNKTTLPPIWQKSMQQTVHLDVCRNGDGNFRKKIVLNKKRQPTFDSWLQDLSMNMKLQSGSVWRVFTPTHGHRIEDYEHLENGNLIVVAGQERFKPLSYGDIEPCRKKSPLRSLDQREPSKRYNITSGKHKKIDTHATVIKCWANGRGRDGSRVVVLPAYRNRPDNIRDVIEMVSNVMCGNCGGAVRNLCELSGDKVRSMDQIRPNGCYVALKRRETFMNDDYHENPLPGLRFSPRLEKKRLPPIPHSNKTSSHSSPEYSMASHNGYRRERERARRHQDDQVYTRPTKHKRSSERVRQTDYDQDAGGVYKARNQNRATQGAREVEDSRHTRTDLPLDQREAETVQEEELDFYSQNDRKDGRSRDTRDRRGRKEEPTPAATQEKDRTYRSNARRADSPSNEQARREREERESEARARREAEDRARKEKQQQQQEAIRRRKKEKEEQERRKREDEEEERKRRAEKERRQKKEEEEERQRKREKERKRSREEEKERRAAASRRTPSPDRYEDTNYRSARESPPPRSHDERPGTETLQDKQHWEGEQEERAATKIQAGYRGYRDRQDLKQKKAAAWKEERERERKRAEEEEERAATKIQAGFRGYQERRELKQRREERYDSGRDDAQPSPVRREADDDDVGNPPVDNEDDRAEQERAATKIQAGFRGAKARQEFKAMREEKEAW